MVEDSIVLPTTNQEPEADSEPSKPVAFRLDTYSTIVAILALLVAICLSVLMAYRQGLESDGVAWVTGRVLGMFVWPLVLSYGAFRFSRRSNRVGNVVFVLVLLLSAFSMGLRYAASERRANREQMVKSTAEYEAETAKARKLAAAGNSEQAAEAAAAATAKHLDEMVARSSGTEKIVIEYAAVINTRQSEATKLYLDSVGAFQRTGGFALVGLSGIESVQARLDALEASIRVHADLLGLLRSMVDRVRTDLAAKGVPTTEIEAFIRGATANDQVGKAIKSNELEHEMLGAMKRRFEILRKTVGNWEVDAEGTLQVADGFPDPDLEEYNKMGKRYAELSAEQEKITSDDPAPK